MKYFYLLLSLVTVLFPAKAITLSPDAEISVITCAPGDMIYDCFGHTAIRIYDPAQRLDRVYNYGIYDFNVPNFELNFAKGYLKYKLGRGYFQKFIPIYTRDDRTITEQVLDLDSLEKQQFFGFMEWNALPENRYYFYDYFDDNCATRVMEVINDQMGVDVCGQLEVAVGEEQTIRELIHQYAHNNVWSALGIDMCMGVAIDQPMKPCQYVFLPDYLLWSLEAYTTEEGSSIVKDQRVLYQGTPRASTPFIKGPLFWFWFIALGMLVLYGTLGTKGSKTVDNILFAIVTFLGLFMLSLWFFTDHDTTAWNMNVLWAQPLLIVAVFLKGTIKARFFQIWAVVLVLLLLNWFWLPQSFNAAFAPIIGLLAFRAYANYKRLALPN